jgi:hypothetical protein
VVVELFGWQGWTGFSNCWTGFKKPLPKFPGIMSAENLSLAEVVRHFFISKISPAKG